MKAVRIFAGRREGELLAFPSVSRMVTILSQRCREESWVRTSVASLERFRTMTGHHDLEALRDQALADLGVAQQALTTFASALSRHSEDQISALAMGPKIWFRLNGIAVPWRPLPGIPSPTSPAATDQQGAERVILLALIGSGLRLAELLRLRRGDVGSLDREGCLIADIEADPLAVRYTPRRGKQGERITFLTFQARQALLTFLAAGTGKAIDLEAPLIAPLGETAALRSSVIRARHRSRALIQAGNNVNVELCRTTGDFFRSWGLPGSRFTGPEELNLEEYI